MVVIPERRGVLPVGVVAKHRLARDEPVLGIAIALGRRAGAVKMNDGADVRLVGLRAVEVVIDRQEVPAGKQVDPLHDQPLAAAGLESRTGNG
jgi:hypothetical protein